MIDEEKTKSSPGLQTTVQTLRGFSKEVSRIVLDYLLLCAALILLIFPLSLATAIAVSGDKFEQPLTIKIGLVIVLGGASIWLILVCLVTAWRLRKWVTCPFCGGRTRRRTAVTKVSGLLCSYCGLLIADPGSHSRTVGVDEARTTADVLLEQKREGNRLRKSGLKQIAIGAAIFAVGISLHHSAGLPSVNSITRKCKESVPRFSLFRNRYSILVGKSRKP